VIALLASRDDRRRWARAIAVMRHGFGGHPFGRDERFAAARRTSRIGGYPTDE
jgi:6-phosphogluconate dehydrogenase